jgi:PhoH-like ATPase
LKIYDTNCLIDNPSLIQKNKDEIIVPFIILDELDGLKNSKNVGYNARTVLRAIKKYNIKCQNFKLSEQVVDKALLDICRIHELELITGDYRVYLEGKENNIKCEHYQPDINTYTGVVKRKLTPDEYNQLQEHNSVGWSKEKLHENQYVDCDSILARYRSGTLHKVSWSNKHKIQGIDELNRRQVMAYDAIFNPDITTVILWGVAGTGKTALAIKSAIQLAQQERYSNVLLSRPNVQIGEELGILPGGIKEKQDPFIKPFEDNMKSFQMKTVPEIQPLQTAKGRDIKDTFFIIDEAQDIEPDKMKMLVERMGKGSKLVLTGDVRQVDKRGLSPAYNGLSFVANRLKGSRLTACVELDKVERSESAKELGELLRR